MGISWKRHFLRWVFSDIGIFWDDPDYTHAKKGKKKLAGNGGFRGSSGSAAVSSQFHMILFSSKATAVPNFRAVTLLWADIMSVLLLVSKSDTSDPPPPLKFYQKKFYKLTCILRNCIKYSSISSDRGTPLSTRLEHSPQTLEPSSSSIGIVIQSRFTFLWY